MCQISESTAIHTFLNWGLSFKMFICRLLIKQSGIWLGLMAFHILVESRLYTMFHYLGCCSRRCPSDPMYPWPTSEFTCRQSRWSFCLWMASHFRNSQLSASLPKIFFPAREFAQQHREERSARDPIPWEKQSVNLHPGLLVWTIQEACFTWFLRGFPMGWSPSCPRTCSWMKLYWIFSLPSRFPPPPSMWFIGSISPDKLIGSLSWGLLSRKPKLRLMPWRQLKTSNRCFYIYLFVLHLTLQRICGDLELNTLNKIMNS